MATNVPNTFHSLAQLCVYGQCPEAENVHMQEASAELKALFKARDLRSANDPLAAIEVLKGVGAAEPS